MRIQHLPYVNQLSARALADIDLVVIHCTELPDMNMAREYGERILYPQSGTGNSGHWYIDEAGKIIEYVPAERIAHHVRGYNPRSIGIELSNPGRYPHWHDSRSQAMQTDYPSAQIDALLSLLNTLHDKLPALRWIAGHDQLDQERIPSSDDPAVLVQRKLDPGPHFPWQYVLERCRLERLPAVE